MVRTNYYFEIRVNAITARFINKLKKRERERERSTKRSNFNEIKTKIKQR